MSEVKSKNGKLNRAKVNKNDEFYTRLEDIQAELQHYEKEFENKTVYCNCDDPYKSNFVKYFLGNFERLKLKCLFASGFSITGYSEPSALWVNKYNISFAKDNIKNVVFSIIGNDNKYKASDFRSDTSLNFLDQSDIVVTNPPFSLFREYVAQLMEYGKKFLIIGNINAICYKDIFSLFVENKIWYGISIHSGDRKFFIPADYPLNTSGCGVDANGKRFIKVKGVRWFTNIQSAVQMPFLASNVKYNPDKYKKYDNYNAINVDKIKDIPMDYGGEMGVPVSFLDKYNPEQFEIVRFRKGDDDRDLAINGKCPYVRVIIKKI